MAYTRYTATYDPTLKNKVVSITERTTGIPAVILSTTDGGTLSDQGVARLNDRAELDVVIDTSKQWDFFVQDDQSISSNVTQPKQIVTRAQLFTLSPKRGITYVVDQPPYPEYRWDGNNLVSGLTSREVGVVRGLSDSSISDITLNSSGKLQSYVSQDILHTITYPDANTIVFSNETGVIKTVTLDNAGIVVSIT